MSLASKSRLRREGARGEASHLNAGPKPCLPAPIPVPLPICGAPRPTPLPCRFVGLRAPRPVPYFFGRPKKRGEKKTAGEAAPRPPGHFYPRQVKYGIYPGQTPFCSILPEVLPVITARASMDWLVRKLGKSLPLPCRFVGLRAPRPVPYFFGRPKKRGEKKTAGEAAPRPPGHFYPRQVKYGIYPGQTPFCSILPEVLPVITARASMDWLVRKLGKSLPLPWC